MSAPRDFLEELEGDDYSSHKYTPRDFLESSEPEETLGQAALYAVPRIAEDVLKSGYEGIQNIPEYWQQAKSEVPGYFNPLNFMLHPIDRGKHTLAGLLQLGQKINHAPHDIANYAANRLHIIPEEWANRVPKAPDIDEANDYYLGTPKVPGEAFARGIGRNADVLLGGNALLKAMPHLTKRGATKTLNKAQRLAEEREIGTLNVNPELIEDARQFLPDLMQHRNELNASHAGDYKSLFDLQANLGKISASRMGKIRSLFSPESHIKGQAGLESRRNLLDAIHENLNALGHEDISKLLKQGQEDYRRYMNFRKYPRLLGGAAAAYAVPKNPLTDLVKKLWSHGG